MLKIINHNDTGVMLSQEKPSVGVYLFGLCPVLVIIDKAAMTIFVHVFVWTLFISLERD